MMPKIVAFRSSLSLLLNPEFSNMMIALFLPPTLGGFRSGPCPQVYRVPLNPQSPKFQTDHYLGSLLVDSLSACC